MIALLQRVSEASVTIEGCVEASIGAGLLAFIAVEPDDGEAVCERIAERLLGYRVFADAAGRMNCSVGDVGGALLLVPQFTLAADTRKGMRPGFSGGAKPELAQRLFERLVACVAARFPAVQAGRFGADMQVALINDGPATFLLRAE